MIITLRNQEDGIELPVYARHSAVSGDILIQETNVVAVSVKVGLVIYHSFSWLTHFNSWKADRISHWQRAVP
jgi:hypothetical protein